MNNNCIVPLLLIVTVSLLILMCTSKTKESMCLCNGPQIHRREQEKQAQHERIRSCKYPSHMIGVV